MLRWKYFVSIGMKLVKMNSHNSSDAFFYRKQWIKIFLKWKFSFFTICCCNGQSGITVVLWIFIFQCCYQQIHCTFYSILQFLVIIPLVSNNIYLRKRISLELLPNFPMFMNSILYYTTNEYEDNLIWI